MYFSRMVSMSLLIFGIPAVAAADFCAQQPGGRYYLKTHSLDSKTVEITFCDTLTPSNCIPIGSGKYEIAELQSLATEQGELAREKVGLDAGLIALSTLIGGRLGVGLAISAASIPGNIIRYGGLGAATGTAAAYMIDALNPLPNFKNAKVFETLGKSSEACFKFDSNDPSEIKNRIEKVLATRHPHSIFTSSVSGNTRKGIGPDETRQQESKHVSTSVSDAY